MPITQIMQLPSGIQQPHRLSDLPADILLHTINFCEIEEAVSLSLVSMTFRRLAQERGYWMATLNKTRLTRPISCLLHEDLSKHDLTSLRAIVFRTLRLERNWSSPHPKPTKPIKKIHIGHKVDIIFQIPGSGLYLLHLHRDRCLVCWDIDQEKPVSTRFYIGARLVDVSPGCDEPGRFSMALLLHHRRKYSILVICVEHDAQTWNVKSTFEDSLEPEWDHWAIFMNDDVCGVLRCNPAVPDPSIDIIAFNKLSGKKTIIRTNISLESRGALEGHSGTSSFGDDVFILIEEGMSSFQYKCSKHLLPYGWNKDCPDESKLVHPETSPIEWDDSEHTSNNMETGQIGALSADPHFGVPAVTIHQKDRFTMNDSRDCHVCVRFWTRSDEDKVYEICSPSLIPKCSIDIPGILHDSAVSAWNLMLLTHSGRHILLVLEVEGNTVLRLVRYNHNSGMATAHNLNLPSEVSLDRIYGLALDDHSGVVTLLDAVGVIYAIEYS